MRVTTFISSADVAAMMNFASPRPGHEHQKLFAYPFPSPTTSFDLGPVAGSISSSRPVQRQQRTSMQGIGELRMYLNRSKQPREKEEKKQRRESRKQSEPALFPWPIPTGGAPRPAIGSFPTPPDSWQGIPQQPGCPMWHRRLAQAAPPLSIIGVVQWETCRPNSTGTPLELHWRTGPEWRSRRGITKCNSHQSRSFEEAHFGRITRQPATGATRGLFPILFPPDESPPSRVLGMTRIAHVECDVQFTGQ